MNKASKEVLKFAEKATHEHTTRIQQPVQPVRSKQRRERYDTDNHKRSQCYRRSGASRGTRARLLTLSHRRSNNHECGEEGKEHLERSSKAAGYAALKVCLSVYYRLERQSQWLPSSRDAILHIDGETLTRALSVANQHVKCKEMSSSVDLGVPQH